MPHVSVKVFRESLSRKLALQNEYVREFFGELSGTCVMIILGCGVLAQHFIGGNGHQEHGTFISVALTWGMAVCFGVFWAGKVARGHINPAMTLAIATTGKFPWRKVPLYWAGQYLGAFLGTLVVYAVYHEQILKYDNSTLDVMTSGNIFFSVPNAKLNGPGTPFIDQFLGTAFLAGSAFAVIDPYGFEVPNWMHPVYLGLLVTAIVSSFALNVGAPLNPARDLGPRSACALLGYGEAAFTNNNYYFWVPLVGCHLGAIFGVWMYELMVGLHNEEKFLEKVLLEKDGDHAKSTSNRHTLGGHVPLRHHPSLVGYLPNKQAEHRRLSFTDDALRLKKSGKTSHSYGDFKTLKSIQSFASIQEKDEISHISLKATTVKFEEDTDLKKSRRFSEMSNNTADQKL